MFARIGTKTLVTTLSPLSVTAPELEDAVIVCSQAPSGHKSGLGKFGSKEMFTLFFFRALIVHLIDSDTS
jgi:hypothetical protein